MKYTITCSINYCKQGLSSIADGMSIREASLFYRLITSTFTASNSPIVYMDESGF